MKKVMLVIVIMVLSISVTSCGGTESETQAPAGTAEKAVSAATPMDTPTAIVLATPTPKPAPSTPTPRPPTTTPEPEIEETEGAVDRSSEGEGEETMAEPEQPAAPPITDIMVEIPAGVFTMGSDSGDPEDAPAHEVDLPVYEIDQFEVTNLDFDTFVQATGYQTYAEQKGYRSWKDEWETGVEDNHPVVMVDWEDANAYCQWLGKRLPTEPEWEKAARGDDGRSLPWGDDWDASKANVKETGLRGTAAVGSFGDGVSPYGVNDMAGNVWEWTTDWYQAFPGNTDEDPYYGEVFRVTRGGGWFDGQPQVTTFNRNAADPSKTANDDLGFRCAR